MSSRIIRGDERLRKLQVRHAGHDFRNLGLTPQSEVQGLEQSAYQRGFADGERASREAAEAAVQAAAHRYAAALGEMAAAQRQIAETMEAQVVRLALEVARNILQREVSIDPALVTAMATAAIRRVQSHQMVTVRVSRSDFERVRDAIHTANPGITVLEDPALERGDFGIDTAQTHMNGALDNQVEVLGRVMLEES